MAYVYKHIRLDKNEIFYIGIGKYDDNNFKRAYSKKSRNKLWTNIVNKHGYTVEIICENLTWNEACEKEKELIQFYGRECFNKGPLINMTDGGDGQSNMHPDVRNSMIKKLKKIKKKPRDLQYRMNISKSKMGAKNGAFGKPSKRAKPVLQFDLNNKFIQEFPHSYEAAKCVKGSHSHIAACCRGTKKTHMKFIWKFKSV